MAYPVKIWQDTEANSKGISLLTALRIPSILPTRYKERQDITGTLVSLDAKA
jgi:hypothetical protein